MSKDASIGWMYEGAKGDVHREDYLLGKSLDKNFEKYSDVVNVQKAEAIDTIVGTRAVFNSGQSTGLKTSSLQKDIIKSEDPFVAVKVREETKRREFMDNPLNKLKVQNALKLMMTAKSEKKKEKKSKKDKKKKKKKKRSRSSSSDASDEEDSRSRKKKKKNRSPSPKRRRTSDRSEEPRSVRRRDSSKDRRSDEKSRKKNRSPSPKRRRRTSDRSEEPRQTRRRDSSGDRWKDDKEKIRRRSPSPHQNRKMSDRNEDYRSFRKRDHNVDRRREEKERRRSRSRSAERKRDTRHHSKESNGDRRREDRRNRLSRSGSGDKRTDKRQFSQSSRDKSKTRTDERKRRESQSPERSPSSNPFRQHLSRRDTNIGRGSPSRSPSPKNKPDTSSRQFDSHIPRHLQDRSRSPYSGSESDHEKDSRRRDDDQKEDVKKSYGLVEMRKRTAEEKEQESKAPSKEYKLIKIPTGRGDGTNANKQREPRRVLTDEERAARLAEMQDNVKWREEVRVKNVEKGKIEDEEEKDEADKNGYAPSFIRSQMREACDDMTVEKRLQSNKRGVQRSHGYMDRSFARK